MTDDLSIKTLFKLFTDASTQTTILTARRKNIAHKTIGRPDVIIKIQRLTNDPQWETRTADSHKHLITIITITDSL
jgi:hypothetical protein